MKTMCIAAIAASVLPACRGEEVELGGRSAMAEPAQTRPAQREPDIHYVPTPTPVVAGMLRLANVGPDDTVYDLGSGDGRIVIAAARDFGARAVGIDIDPVRVREARANVRKAGVADRVEIRQGDLFEVDLSGATVVTLYLLQSLNEKLRPKLQRELRPGSRVVSQTFHMGDWKPAATRKIGDVSIFLWNIAARPGRARPAR